MQDYFFFGAEAGPLRFTRTQSTFCIISLERPRDGLLVIRNQVPIMQNDMISLLGAGPAGNNLPWSSLDGIIVIEVAEGLLDKVHGSLIYTKHHGT
jgi:alpha-L-fucosidase